LFSWVDTLLVSYDTALSKRTYQVLSSLPLTSPTYWLLLIAPHSASLAVGTTIPRPTVKSPHTTIGIPISGRVGALLVSHLTLESNQSPKKLTALSLFRQVSHVGRCWSHFSLDCRHESHGCCAAECNSDGFAKSISGFAIIVCEF
jgi:hypothetical protein